MMRSVQIVQESLIRRAAGTNEAGPSIEDIGAVCDRLAREGIANTVCFWDVYANHPDFVSRACAGILDVAEKTSDCYLCLKPAALNFDLEMLTKVLAEAG